jgi:hypothetical protein
VKRLLHVSQTWGFSPEWIRRWVFNDDEVENALEHTSHSCGFSPEKKKKKISFVRWFEYLSYQYEYEYVELIMMDDQMLLDTFHIATFDVLFVYQLKRHWWEYLSMIEEVFDFYLLMRMMMMQESGQS